MTTPSPRKISVYADGSSGGDSKGAIGWGWIIVDWEGGDLHTGCGNLELGTNNMAEISGAIDGLKELKRRGLHVGNIVEVVSDSTYALGIASGSFEPQKNLELAAELRKLVLEIGKETAFDVDLNGPTPVHTRWVKGHSGEAFNDKCDQLAKHARDKISPEDKKSKRRSRRREERRRKRSTVKAFLRGEIYREPLRLN